VGWLLKRGARRAVSTAAATGTGHREHQAQDQRPESAVYRIAVIDQRVAVRDLFKRGLELAGGFEVETAATIEEWLEGAQNSPVHLVLISLRSDRSAIELQDKMKALSSRHTGPVAVLADRDFIDAERVGWILEQGAQGFISTEMPLDAAVHILRMIGAADTNPKDGSQDNNMCHGALL
jgi:DNA-binding NarL/FixJ family response regulator